MALRKQTMDVQAADGLQQKVDLRRLPSGKAAQALNLVKNKQGRLEKRLGFLPLAVTDPLGSGFKFSTGINLGTWNQNLLTIGRGAWSPAGSTVTALSTYSDDLTGMVHRGQLPDVKVTTDTILADTPTIAATPTMGIIGDTAVAVWMDGPAVNTDTIQSGTVMYWMAWEVSTGNIIQPATTLSIASGVTYFRLATLGTAWVVASNWTGAPSAISFSVLTPANILSGTGWIATTPIADQCVQTPSTMPFDMRAVSGDPTAFVLAYEKGTLGSLGTPSSIVAQRYTLSGTTISAPTTFVVQPTPSSTIAQVAFGIRADQTTGRCCVVYCQPTSLTFPDAATQFQVHAATCTYPAMGFVNGSSTNDTNIYTAVDVHEPWPIWIDVVLNGSGGQLLGGPWFTAVWSPMGAVWNNQAQRSGTQQTNPNRIVNTHATPRPPIASRCARIIGNTFRDGANSLTLGNSGNIKASITPGLTLASRGLEANGVAYFLGWVPSYTQGSFIVLAFDQLKNATKTGNGYPMRPVGNLQVRTALGDPGYGSLIDDAGSSLYSTSSVSPNVWTGASEWPLGSDIFTTSYVAYVAGTQGARFQPAYAAIQTLPLTGYPMAQWGTITAIGGGLPMCFDGQSVFEQGFLYAPESVLVDPGTATTPAGGVQLQGPYWTTAATDAYSWIFTWEQFDAQGNFHISARSQPVTVTSAQLATYDGSGSGNGYRQPTFYIPTLGATCRQKFGGTPVPANTFIDTVTPPTYVPTLGVYRTTRNGQVYFRVADRYFNGSDSLYGTFPNNKTDNTMFVTYKDTAVDQPAYNQWVTDTGGAQQPAYFLDGGTFPELYGDGSNGAPGSLDNFCPPSSSISVKHKERLFVSRNNQILFTKQRGELAGPGYNEQVNIINVGDSTPIIGMESMDDKLIVFKPNQMYYIAGDGPADDGTGSSFQSPQPISTDSGCSDPASIRSTPEGVYFMSTAGLRRLSRSLGVEYVGGPVEDELTTYPDVRSVVLYPGQNRVVFACTNDDTPNTGGEMIWRDYVLDAWTTAQVNDAGSVRTAVSLAVANAPRASNPPNSPAPVLHFLTSGGVVWREKDPAGLNGDNFYFDNNTYIGSTWQSPPIKQQDGSRFRLWDIVVFGNSVDPHGLLVTVTVDDGTNPETFQWVWNSPSGAPSIRPGGVAQTGLTRMRAYDGRMGASFQITVQDVSDTHAVSGQGLQLLGLSLTTGVAPGPYKLAPGSTQ